MLIILVIYFRNKLVKRRMIQTHYNYNNNNNNKKKINQLKLKRKRIKILKYSNKSNHNPK